VVLKSGDAAHKLRWGQWKPKSDTTLPPESLPGRNKPPYFSLEAQQYQQAPDETKSKKANSAAFGVALGGGGGEREKDFCRIAGELPTTASGTPPEKKKKVHCSTPD